MSWEGNQPVGSPVADPAPAVTDRRGGRAALTDDLLRDIAVRYLIETLPGQPPGAMKRMSARFGRPEETIRTWVGRARRDGWLGPSVKGRAGAEPGPRLQLSVDEMNDIYSGLIEHVVVRKVVTEDGDPE